MQTRTWTKCSDRRVMCANGKHTKALLSGRTAARDVEYVKTATNKRSETDVVRVQACRGVRRLSANPVAVTHHVGVRHASRYTASLRGTRLHLSSLRLLIAFRSPLLLRSLNDRASSNPTVSCTPRIIRIAVAYHISRSLSTKTYSVQAPNRLSCAPHPFP